MIDEPIVCKEINKISVSFKAIIFDSGLRHLQIRRIKFTSILGLNWELINIRFRSFLFPSLRSFFFNPVSSFFLSLLRSCLTSLCTRVPASHLLLLFVTFLYTYPLLIRILSPSLSFSVSLTQTHTHSFTHTHNLFLQPFIFKEFCVFPDQRRLRRLSVVAVVVVSGVVVVGLLQPIIHHNLH